MVAEDTVKLSLARKIGIAVISVLLLIGCATLALCLKLADIEATSHRLATVRIPAMRYSEDLEGQLNQSASKLREYILIASNRKLAEKASGSWEKCWKSIDDDLAGLQHLSAAAAGKADQDSMAKVVERVGEYKRLQKRVFELRQPDDPRSIETASVYMSTTTAPFNDETKKLLGAIIERLERSVHADSVATTAEISLMRNLLWISALFALALGGCIAVLGGRKLIATINEIGERAKAIAGHDLSGEALVVRSADEIGELVGAMNAMQASLTGVIQQVTSSAEHVASASEEISASATQQSQGVTVQKDQTQQVATAMHEMASSVGQISEGSSRAAEAAQKASQAAEGGGRIVEQTLDHIQSIAASVSETAQKIEALGKSSDQIGKIIGVIDDIADQTNLLALNAAIEAARAGEQGRGFAVVADEVRKLAERTSTATKEIAGMIEGIQQETHSAVEAMQAGTEKVESGVETTRQAGESLRAIIASASQVGEMVTQIATAAHQQTSVTEEVNRNLEQIAKVTAETATGAQESAKACQGLSNLAFDLQNVVGQFKTAQTTDGPMTTPQKTSARSWQPPATPSEPHPRYVN